jgi:hypothetical protein
LLERDDQWVVDTAPATDTSELLLLLEEHAERHDGAVDQQTSNYRHGHGASNDQVAMREDDG